MLLASLALVACGEGMNVDTDPSTSSTSGYLDGGTADAGNPNAVTGTRTLHYRVDIGDFTQPVDTVASPITAFTYGDGGTTTALAVAQNSDGTFNIPNAPAGDYYLAIGSNYYVVTSARSLNLDHYSLGRPDAATTTTAPQFAITATNADPIPGYPNLELVSSNLGTDGYLSGETSVPDGTTALTNYITDYGDISGLGFRLADPTKGDRFYVNQLVDQTGDLFTYTTISKSFAPAPVTMTATPAAPYALNGTFTAARNQKISFAWWRSRFEAFGVHVHPQATPYYQYLEISPMAWGSDAWYGYSGDLLGAQLLPGDITDITPTVSFGNPYPYSWGITAAVSHFFRTPTRLPGTTSGGLTVGMNDWRRIDSFLAGPIAPRITPPAGLFVDGVNAQQDSTLSSLTPRVSWRAPLIGTPSSYRVRVSRLYLDSTGKRTLSATVASLVTANTSVVLPPGVLQVGQKYAITVYAYLTPGVDSVRQPFALEALYDAAYAATVSSILTTPATLAPLRSVVAEGTPLIAPDRFETLDAKHTPER